MRPAALTLASAMLLASSARAELPRPKPRLLLAFEPGFSETDGARSRGLGANLAALLRLTDQLSVAGGGGFVFTRGGPFATLAFGLEALFDSTPIAPFLAVQVVLLDPASLSGYQLAARTGLGADVRVARGLALGLAVRTLTPLDPGASAATGLEVVLRIVVAPSGLDRP